jgi:hypothetical protein
MQTVHQPCNVETFGEFRKMMMTGDFAAKVQLTTAMAKHPTVAVGALSDAQGKSQYLMEGSLSVMGKQASRLTRVRNTPRYWSWNQSMTGKAFE